MPIPQTGVGPILIDPVTFLRSPSSGSAATKGVPYIIWRKGGGFFSTLSSVLGHLRLAEALGYTPIVDFQNFPTIYSEHFPVQGTMNAWEYYFQPVSRLRLEEAYKSPLAVLSSGKHPSGTPQSVSQDPSLVGVYEKYVKLNNVTSEYVVQSVTQMGIGGTTLGVHFRGGEMRRAPAHPYPPTKNQVRAAIDRALDLGSYENIFLVTEQKDYADFFARIYRGKLLLSDSFRAFKRNPYRMSPRSNHRYLLGLEVLRDMYLLSECGGLVSGSSNVSEMSILLNQGKYRVNYQIRNGSNSTNRVASRISWYLRSVLPATMGGFAESVLEPN